MAEMKHLVEQQGGVTIHREIPAARKAEDFYSCNISEVTRDAFKRVCLSGGATPQDFRSVFSALIGKAVVDEIVLK